MLPATIHSVDTRYIGRLAPSPTGLLHLGHAATFWAACRRAEEQSGTLLLRNEDLDPQRSRPEFVAAMLEDLAWLGILWTPPMLSQSTRLSAYRAAFDQLLATGLVYRCTCSRRDLASSLAAPHEDLGTGAPVLAEVDPDDEPTYNGRCRPAEPTPIAEFTPGNYRLRVPDGETIYFNDLNLGAQSFTALAAPNPSVGAAHSFGDFLIWRRPLVGTSTDAGAPQPALSEAARPSRTGLDSEMWDGSTGLPSYQLACVVDDAFQQITEAVRGADLLKSTARQILLQGALGVSTPAYFHTCLLRDERGVRLAKRHDSLAIRTLREQGMTAEEVLGRLADVEQTTAAQAVRFGSDLPGLKPAATPRLRK